MTVIITRFSASNQTPHSVLSAAIDENPKAVVVLARGADGRWSARWSNMTHGDLCVAEKWLSIEVSNAISEGGDSP